MTTPNDPSAFFRDMLGQWEKFTNTVGGDAMKSDAFAGTMHGATSAAMNAQGMLRQVMERTLAAANMPSKADLEDLSARIARVEAALFRIEAKLNDVAPPPVPATAPRPSRGRTPPLAPETPA